jgi:hypothetical protein
MGVDSQQERHRMHYDDDAEFLPNTVDAAENLVNLHRSPLCHSNGKKQS